VAHPSTIRAVRRDWRLFLYILPALALVLVFSYLPVASAIYHAFFDWSGGDAKQFIGLENFTRAWSDGVLHQSFGIVTILVIANVLKLIPSIFVAVLIHRLSSNRAQYFYRILVVVPMVVPELVTLFVWKFFFDPGLGPLNRFLEATGLHTVLATVDGWLGLGVFSADRSAAWLSDPNLILPALILWGFPWIGAVGVLIYLAGLQSIGQEVYEAAKMDGVGPIRQFFSIELPLILTQVRLMLILLIIGTLQGFGLPLLLLGPDGGAGGAGLVPGLWMYNRAFIAGEFGYACAVGLILFAIILALTWANDRWVRVSK